ncbi:uncharacterized protein LOC133832023 [Humulus lupulus]|uniref:uncharacterized protein LOC133832023 n=1 Tax=Humulus lupulus TaxID=3486 RepID=UPI002B40D227|nr:uncharacterized protein LOC133832023 [Humulus lupulus]
MSLKDNRLTDAFKVEVQLAGIGQNLTSIGTTLHYQVAYKLQDHTLNLSLPTTEEVLLVSVDSTQVPTCTHIPRQISTDDLMKILPSSRITNYEMLHQPQNDVQTLTEPSYHKKEDDSVEIVFDRTQTKTPNCFTTQYMTTFVTLTDVEIQSFNSQGNPIYAFESLDGHKYWEVCDCKSCLKIEEDLPKWRLSSD